MIRIIGFLVGLGFSGVVLLALLFGIGPAFSTYGEHGQFVAPTVEHEFYKESKEPEGGFAHSGIAGRYDTAQLQRGFQVYKEVCAACHSMKYVAFRDLAGIGYNEAEIKAIAADFQVPGIDPDTGDNVLRAGLPTDYFPSPYANDVAAAAANNNAIPPDLSLMTKARKKGDAYVYSLLAGYQEMPAEVQEQFPDFDVSEGLHYNPYFKNLALAMAPPITMDGQVTYAEGNPEPTIRQMSEDVAAFMMWTAEPKMDQRKQLGLPVLGFLLLATILAYLAKKNVWAGAPGASGRRED